MRVAPVAVALVASAAAHADDDPGRDTSRISIGAGGAIYASYPGAMSDAAPAISVGTPLWLGTRHRFFQWFADASATVGYGTDSRHAHITVGPGAGFSLYLGSTVGLEMRVGLGGIAQLGERTVGGVAFVGGGGYVFRLGDDDRQRVKLLIMMQAGGYFASDPMNDTLGSSMLGVSVAYETPF